MRHFVLVLGVAGLIPLVAACTPIGVGAAVGSTAGVAAAHEGGIKSSLEDARIETQINDLWFKRDFDMFRKVNLTVDQGRVLLTGVVQKPEHRVDAVRLAWQPAGVRQVINEIKVAGSDGIKGWARDNWIAGRLRGAILFDKTIQSINYTIECVQGVVYLIGVAQNQGELDKVTLHARQIPYVRQVVSYVKLAGTPLGDLPPTQGVQQGVAGPVTAPVEPVQGVAVEPLGAAGGSAGARPQPIMDGGF